MGIASGPIGRLNTAIDVILSRQMTLGERLFGQTLRYHTLNRCAHAETEYQVQPHRSRLSQPIGVIYGVAG